VWHGVVQPSPAWLYHLICVLLWPFGATRLTKAEIIEWDVKEKGRNNRGEKAVVIVTVARLDESMVL